MDENPDNYSDVDWSDGAEESNDEADVDITKSGGNDETLHLNIGTSTREECNERKRKRDTVVYTDEDRLNALRRHQTDLKVASYRALLVSKWCSDEFLSGVMVSLLPSSFFSLLNQQKNSSVDDLLRVANWFKKFFAKLKDTFLTADEGDFLALPMLCANFIVEFYRGFLGEEAYESRWQQDAMMWSKLLINKDRFQTRMMRFFSCFQVEMVAVLRI